MRIAIASGKGGTGKTLVSTNLARFFASQGHQVRYVDADVEAPNGHLFLHPKDLKTWPFMVKVPKLKTETCSGSACKVCQTTCQFNAILALPKKVLVLPELCHGCGACVLACPERALIETEREIGVIRYGKVEGFAELQDDKPGAAGEHDPFWEAELNIGEAQATPLIRGLLKKSVTFQRPIKSESDPESGIESARESLTIIDAPPGTSCSAVAVVSQADHVILVTEPTPFGLHDLQLAVEMCRELKRPVSVVINRADLGNDAVRDYLAKEELDLITEIPFLRDIASAYASGSLVIDAVPAFAEAIKKIATFVLEQIRTPDSQNTNERTAEAQP